MKYLVLLTLLLTACQSPGTRINSATCPENCIEQSETSLDIALHKSHQKWLELKSEGYTNYHYEVHFSSWVGFGHKTRLRVEQDKIVAREYHAWNNDAVEVEHWLEEGEAMLGSHPPGAALKTIDQLYRQCTDILTQDLAKVETFIFKTDDLGVLKQCQFRRKHCADDCHFGIRIERLSLHKNE